jgi:hypothetical protein
MSSKPMIIIAKHSITIAPSVFDLLLQYIQFFIWDRQMQLHHLKTPEPIADPAVNDLVREINQAQALATAIEPAKEQFARLYEMNFVKLAEVLRQTRIALGLEKIEDMHSLRICLEYLMTMLKQDNPLFSREKFIAAINEGRHL